jgi:anti-sigma regulatory factor (Ser/Thr protein kinase)/anti-anti-sigma regulatory factor
MLTQAKSSHTITVPEDLSRQARDRFDQGLGQLIAGHPSRIDLDCSELHLVTSSHVNVLWRAREKCIEADIPVRLRSLSPGLIRILMVLDIYGLFVTDHTEGESQAGASHRLSLKQGDNRLTASIPPTVEGINDALTNLRTFLNQLSIDDVCRLELETVAYETLTNIRRHGHLSEEEQVEFEVQAFDDRIEFTFTDPGTPFNPAGQNPGFDPGQAISNRQIGGIGLVMIVRMTDSMDYERRDDRLNVLTLTKNWDQRYD